MNRLISLQEAIDALERRLAEPSYQHNGEDWYVGVNSAVCEIEALPSADRQTDEEDQLKFYYVESIDDYWIGMRIDNFYYADWHEGLGFVWSKSRYLPWGETVVDENTLWKVHTYPSKPVEIPFTDWIVGFVKKYFADRQTGKWELIESEHVENIYLCTHCRNYEAWGETEKTPYCPHCGAWMKGADDETN